MTDEITVRTGTPDDVHGMMRLALAACAENGLHNPDPQKLLAEIWASLNLHHGIVGIIGEPNKPFEAAILLRVESLWYTSDLSVVERAIFVHPDYRNAKGGRASKLCSFAKKASETLGYPLVIGILSNERTEAKVRLYERQFGRPAGAYWIFGGHTGLGGVDGR
jgi:GNAT superfamily N-acetyltransferase